EANKYLSLTRGAALSMIYAAPETAALLRESFDENHALFHTKMDNAFALMKKDDRAQAYIQEIQDAQDALHVQYAALLLLRPGGQPPPDRDPELAQRIFDSSTQLAESLRRLVAAYSRPLHDINATVAQQMTFKYTIW